jgi:choline dehydrogenase-like flavoprotein
MSTPVTGLESGIGVPVETATIGEIALFAVGVVGSVVFAVALHDAIRSHRWIRWSENERARRISRRQVRASGARLVACLTAAVVGGAGAFTPGWFFRGTGTALAFGLGVSVSAAILDTIEVHTDRRAPDVRTELETLGTDPRHLPRGV